MTTLLDKPLKRELRLDDRAYTLTVSPQGLKLTEKGRRNGQELAWRALLSGEAALATALNANLAQAAPRRRRPAPGTIRDPALPKR